MYNYIYIYILFRLTDVLHKNLKLTMVFEYCDQVNYIHTYLVLMYMYTCMYEICICMYTYTNNVPIYVCIEVHFCRI